MNKVLWLIAILLSPTVLAENEVSIISRESSFCAKRIVNPKHCQSDGKCYHFYNESNYPVELLKKGVEGKAKVKFDTDSDGCTYNFQILESYPEVAFGQAAVKTLQKYRYSAQSQGQVETFTYRVQK